MYLEETFALKTKTREKWTDTFTGESENNSALRARKIKTLRLAPRHREELHRPVVVPNVPSSFAMSLCIKS